MSEVNTRNSTELADEYVDTRHQLKVISEQLRDVKKNSPHTDQIEQLESQLKNLRKIRALDLPELPELEDKKDELSAKAEAILVVLAHKIKEENPPLLEGMDAPAIEHRGFKFIVRDKLVVQKEK